MRLKPTLSKLKPIYRAKVMLRPKAAAPFYLSAEWRELVDRLIVQRFGSRANARCESKEGRCSRGEGVRIFADHIRELRDGGEPLDPRNIQFLCGSCHTRKSIERRRQRLAHP